MLQPNECSFFLKRVVVDTHSPDLVSQLLQLRRVSAASVNAMSVRGRTFGQRRQ